MNSVYDLTTKAGITAAIATVPDLKSLLKDWWDRLFKSDEDKVLELAKKLIEEGKKNGLKKLTITIEGDKGIVAELKVWGTGKGIQIDARGGSQYKWTITAEY